MDFIDPQSTGNFSLQAEDTQIVDSVGGVEHREIRWRKATLDEARTVVVAFHAQRNLATTANFIVSAPIRRGSGIDNEQQELCLGRMSLPTERPKARTFSLTNPTALYCDVSKDIVRNTVELVYSDGNACKS